MESVLKLSVWPYWTSAALIYLISMKALSAVTFNELHLNDNLFWIKHKPEQL